MQGVTGGSLPALIWKDFITKARPEQVAHEKRDIPQAEEALQPTEAPQVAPEKPLDISLPQQASRPVPEANAASEGPEADGRTASKQSPQCDYRACGAKYQSFNAADCTYQPYGGGDRRRCERAAAQPANFDPEQQSATAVRNREERDPDRHVPDRYEPDSYDDEGPRDGPPTIFRLLLGGEP
jgi:hypothetical protein